MHKENQSAALVRSPVPCWGCLACCTFLHTYTSEHACKPGKITDGEGGAVANVLLMRLGRNYRRKL